jgi:hypothetical protein
MALHAVPVVRRVLALSVVAVACAATASLAAGKDAAAPVLHRATPAPAPAFLVVPDVRGQAHVFAKGMLEEAGFAWRVKGKVQGFSANVVVAQEPAAGTRVADTGQPTIVLRLSRSPKHPERGRPENAAPYDGSAIRLHDPAAGAAR